MTDEWWIKKNIDGIDCSLIEVIIVNISWRNWIKPRKISVRLEGVLTEIRIEYPHEYVYGVIARPTCVMIFTVIKYDNEFIVCG
jgi:hypothetical protein